MEKQEPLPNPQRAASHRRWLGASCVKEWTLRTHRLWWKDSARRCRIRPESCRRKSLGARRRGGGLGTVLESSHPPPPLPLLCPMSSPHCSITTGCSHKGARAEARPIVVKLTNSKRHVPVGGTHRSGGACSQESGLSYNPLTPRP
jgi:hypothetical protein